MPRPTRRIRITERARPSRAAAAAAQDDAEATEHRGDWTNPAVIAALFGLVMSVVLSIHMMSTYKPAPAVPTATAADAAATAAAARSITDTLGMTNTLGVSNTLGLTNTLGTTSTLGLTNTHRIGASGAITRTGAITSAPVKP